MGKSSFEELESSKTSQSRSDIIDLKARLSELNFEIVELEKQADPKTKIVLQEHLKDKIEQIAVLESSKPKEEVLKPEGETLEQKKISENLAKLNTLREQLIERGKKTVEAVTEHKSKLQKLVSIKDSALSLKNRVQSEINEIRKQCESVGLDIEQIFQHNCDLSSVDAKIEEQSILIRKLDSDNDIEFNQDTDYDKILSVPDLRKAVKFLVEKIKTLQETVSAPQKRYQRYIQTISEINKKVAELLGDSEEPKPDTINHLERRINYIETELQSNLEQKHRDREILSKKIYSAKKQVRSFYETLKTSVEDQLSVVSSDEFEVTIDASFVPSIDLIDTIFQLVNRNARGIFRGNVEGRSELERRVSDTDWNDVASVLTFSSGIIEALKENDINKQVKDIKRLYDEIFSFEYFNARYELRLGGKNLNQLSPGEKGLLLLVFYLHLDKEKTPLIIDQPEDNLDNDSIFSVLASCIRMAKRNRQVILITHNPNLAVGADAEEILYVMLDKADDYKFSYESGSIENPRINDIIVKILEGSKPAFVQRRLKYQI